MIFKHFLLFDSFGCFFTKPELLHWDRVSAFSPDNISGNAQQFKIEKMSFCPYSIR